MLKTVLKIVIFLKILDGDPTKITKMSRKIDELEAIAEKQWFSTSERLGSPTRGNSEQELKNYDFWPENRPDRSKSFKMDGFLNESPRAHAQNSAQNRDFSENPRSIRRNRSKWTAFLAFRLAFMFKTVLKNNENHYFFQGWAIKNYPKRLKYRFKTHI